MPRVHDHRWAWLVPALASGVLGAFEDSLVNALGTDRTVALYVVVGSGLGWLWYWLYPRPLAERLWFLTVLGVVATVMLLIGGTDVSRPSPSDAMALGVLIGLVLTETRRPWRSRWAHQRHTALTSRATMQSLR